MMDNKTFGKKLSEELTKQGINQSKLAEIARVSRSIISEYINEKYLPKIENIIKISNALNVSPDYLMCLTDEPNRNLNLYPESDWRKSLSGGIEQVNFYISLKIYIIRNERKIEDILVGYYQYLLKEDRNNKLPLHYTLTLRNVVNRFRDFFTHHIRLDKTDVDTLSEYLDFSIKIDDKDFFRYRKLDHDLSLLEIVKDLRSDEKLRSRETDILVEYERDISLLSIFDLISDERFNKSLQSIMSAQVATAGFAVDFFEKNFNDFINNRLTFVVDITNAVMTYTVPVFDQIISDPSKEKPNNRIRDIEVPFKIASNAGLIGLKFKSDSMNRIIPTNAIVVIDTNHNIGENDICAVSINREDAILAKYHKLSDRFVFEFLSFNQKYDPILVKDGDAVIKIIGKVIWFCSDLDDILSYYPTSETLI